MKIFPGSQSVQHPHKTSPLNFLDDLIDELDMKTNSDPEKEEEDIEKEEEIEINTKDPVKRFQFIYNESLCMTSKYPEIATSSGRRNIEIAPGQLGRVKFPRIS